MHIAPSVTNEEINLNGWGFGGTRQPAWGNTRPAAVNKSVHNDGWGPAPSPANTNDSSHVHSDDPARMDYVPRYGKQSNTKGQPKEKGSINPPTILESVEEIPTTLEREETCVKERNGTAKVQPLP